MVKTVRDSFVNRSTTSTIDRCHRSRIKSGDASQLSRDEAVLARHRTMNPDGASKKLGRAAREETESMGH